MLSGVRLDTLVNCLETADSKHEIPNQIQRKNTGRQEIPVRAIPERNPQKSKSPALLFQTYFQRNTARKPPCLYPGIKHSKTDFLLSLNCHCLKENSKLVVTAGIVVLFHSWSDAFLKYADQSEKYG